mmetsp:Transcript_92078/g.201788  ORF Transcript_92078/g.201788 Transcript_92078/m.201788 type:complete len:502 (-) Transcript_92078:289-1794(-)
MAEDGPADDLPEEGQPQEEEADAAADPLEAAEVEAEVEAPAPAPEAEQPPAEETAETAEEESQPQEAETDAVAVAQENPEEQQEQQQQDGEEGDAPNADAEEKQPEQHEQPVPEEGESPEVDPEAEAEEQEEGESPEVDVEAEDQEGESPEVDAEVEEQEDGDDGEVVEAEAEAEEEESEGPGIEAEMEELQEKIDQLVDLNERAQLHNDRLQRRIIQRRIQDKSYDTTDKQSEGKVTGHKYQNVLHNVHNIRVQLRLQQVKAARMSEELKNQLETKRQRAIECRDSFQAFKREVAKHAQYARTGESIPKKIIQEVEEFELDKEAEVEEVRGSNISLKNRLAKLEQALRKKDELADNLHVIDFEQLKIENQTLNEKIEERNEELHKLRKKTVTTVQIITHMREKIQFVQHEYGSLKGELAELEQGLAAQRDLVAKTKHERDEHRTDSGKLRQQTSIMNSEHLTKDFETRKDHISQLEEDIKQLKQRHKQMVAFVKSHGGTV